MIYLKAGQANNIVVTFTERATDPAALYYVLELTHISTLDVFTFPLLKWANQSQYTNRYDQFVLTLDADFQTGQYKYTAYESTTAFKSGAVGVVETGLAVVEYNEQSFEKWDNTVNYIQYGDTTPQGQTAVAATISPNEGTFAGSVEITLTSPTPNNRIYYTTNGTVPTSQNGTLYDPDNKPNFLESTTIKTRVYADGFNFSAVSSASFVIIGITLTVTPDSGEYLIGDLDPIEAITNDEDAAIHYTTNGTDPTTGSTLYTGAVAAFAQITTFKARAFNPPAAPSPIVTKQYDIKALPPVVTTNSGTYTSQVVPVVINPNAQGIIQFRINSGAWQTYASAPITSSATVDFRIFADGIYIASEPVSRTYTIQVATPTISPNGGIINSATPITVTSDPNGANTFYTTNGIEPTPSSTPYTSALTFPDDTQLRVKSFRTGAEASAQALANFVVLDADAVAFLNAAGITDPTISAAVEVFVTALKTNSVWDRLQAIYPFVGGTAETHKWNLKDPRDLDAAYRLQFIGGLTHSSQGVTPNGTTGYARTFYNIANFNSQDGISFGVDLTTAWVSGTSPVAIGTLYNGGTGQCLIDYFSSNLRYLNLSTTARSLSGTSPAGQGIWFVTRNRTTNLLQWFSQAGTRVDTTEAETAITTGGEMFLMARDNVSSGLPDLFSAQRQSFAFIGNDLSTAQFNALRAAYVTFKAAVR